MAVFEKPTKTGTGPKDTPAVGRWEGAFGRLRARPRQGAVIIAVCVAVIGLVGYLLAVQAHASYHWKEAKEALERIDLTAARKHLEVCVNAWPTSAETQFLMGRTCRRLGDIDASRTHLKKAEELDWVRELIDLEYVMMQAQTGAIRPVEQTLINRLKQGFAEEGLIFEALVKGYLQVNILGDAYHWATIWMERYPKDWQPYYWRGLALERGSMLNLAPEAAEDYTRALELKPDLLDARLRLAEVQAKTGSYADALANLKIYRDHFPDHPTAMTATIRCLRSSGKSDDARELLDDWLKRNLGNGIAYMVRGQLEMDRDRPDEALKWLHRPECKALVNVEMNQTMALVHRRLGQNAEAARYEDINKELEKDFKRMEVLTKESFSNPKDALLRYEAGTILLKHGQNQEAARWLLSALLEDPKHKPTHKALAELYAKIGDKARAEDHRRKAEESP